MKTGNCYDHVCNLSKYERLQIFNSIKRVVSFFTGKWYQFTPSLKQLGQLPDPDGYEVSRIYIMRPHKAFGINFEESEIITSNDQFFTDGSGAFRNLDKALRHFDKLSNKHVRHDNVDDLSSSDSELIEECQTV